MLKPKAALVQDKFVEPNGKTWTEGDQNKKGRLSLPAIERCKELAGKGIQIEGYSVSKSDDSNAAVVTKVKHDPNVISDLVPQTRGVDLIPMVNGKIWPIGIKGLCNICKISLTHCPCPAPKVWFDFQTEGVVTFKPSVVTRKA